MAGNNDGKNYELIEVSKPESLLIRGEKENVNMADCQELARLEAVWVIMEDIIICKIL